MKKIFVSDIHMGDERSLKPDDSYCSDKGLHRYGWLGAERADKFAEFLQSCVLNDSEVQELVILGDLFDVWVCPASCDPLGGTGDIRKQLEAIADAPQNKGIIGNLRQIAKTRKLTYVNGNHDMQLTKEIIGSIIHGINYTVDEIYKIPDQGIWAEHGHHYTLFNAEDSYDYQGSTHILPIGHFITRLVAQYCANTGRNEDNLVIFADIVLEVLKVHGELLDELLKGKMIDGLLRAVYAGFQDYVYGTSSPDMTTTMNGDDHFQGLIKASEVNSLYDDLGARWKKRPNHANILLAFLSDFIAGCLKQQAHFLSSEKDRRLIIFGHTHVHDLSHYFPTDRLDKDPHFAAKYGDKYSEVIEKLSQAVAETSASLTCGEEKLYANTGSWVDSVKECTYLETEESGETLWVVLKEYLGGGRCRTISQFVRLRKESQFRAFDYHIPPGSYSASSEEIRLTLYANCPDTQGNDHKTKLDIPDFYDKTDIENKDGILQLLDKHLTPADIARLRAKRKELGGGKYVPIGSYLDSATKISVKLSADCKNRNGDYCHRELDITSLDDNRDIKNNDGKLEC